MKAPNSFRSARESVVHRTGEAGRQHMGLLKRNGPNTWLLVALVLMLVISPLIDNAGLWGKLAIGVLNSAILISGALVSRRSRLTIAIACIFAVPAFGLEWAAIVTGHQTVELLLGGTMVLFYCFTLSHILIAVLKPGPVTGDKLHGAVACYIVMALLWSFVYAIVDHLLPGSFNYLGSLDTGHSLRWREFMFFSFTTLTTTGYGDAVPVSGVAQSAAILEQLVGTFYVAILIARLAALYEPKSARG